MSPSTSTVPTLAAAFDPFGDTFLLDPYPHHDRLRRAGPIVRLETYDSWMTGHHDIVTKVLVDHETFCSGRGVGLANFAREKPWRTPSLLLETDPPAHTPNRAVISRALSPRVQRRMRAVFERQAKELVGKTIVGGELEVVRSLCMPFPLTLFADAVGVPSDGRDHLIQYGSMVFNTMGPENDNYRRAMDGHEPVVAWVTNACQRHALTGDGLGAMIYDAADEEKIDEASAALIVRSFLSAGIDTTAAAAANLLYLFADNPDQWQRLKADPALTRSAVEEVLRLESPFQMFFRTTTRPVEIGGVHLGENEKVLASLGAANRDPQRWERPDAFDITRTTTGHMAFGAGIHGCVGQMMARLELEVFLDALRAHVATIEFAGTPVWLSHNTLRTLERLPIRFTLA